MDNIPNIKFKTVDEYLSAVPGKARKIWNDQRQRLKRKNR
jgi:hypothetical protein